MKKIFAGLTIWAVTLLSHTLYAQEKQAYNPVLFADVPDMSIVRVGNTYYMSSTTMHMSPGVPIMKSKDIASGYLTMLPKVPVVLPTSISSI